MDLLAHKQPKKFWLGGRKNLNNSLDWANIIKPELKKDPAYFGQVILSDDCMLR
jgi:hypothetical protein